MPANLFVCNARNAGRGLAVSYLYNTIENVVIRIHFSFSSQKLLHSAYVRRIVLLMSVYCVSLSCRLINRTG